MNASEISRSSKILLVTLAMAAMLTACATDPATEARGNILDGASNGNSLDILEKMSRTSSKPVYRTEYFRQRELSTAQWLAQAETLRMSGHYEAAAALYQRIQEHDPQNARARSGLRALEEDQRQRAVLVNAENHIRNQQLDTARDLLRPILNQNPAHLDARRLQREIDDRTLKPAMVTPTIKTTSSSPITLELHNVTVRSVFDVIARTTGLSFIFDRDIRAETLTSIAVRNAAPAELIQLVLVSNQLAQKIINPTTILIYPNVPQKQREYQELVLRTFYLANADVKQTESMIRTLIKTRDIFVDEKLNMLVMKDTPAAIRMAENLIAAHDLAEPEVMLEVEVLEVGSNRLLDLGLRFPDSVAWSLAGGGTTTTTTGGASGAGSTTTTTGGTPGLLTLPEWLNRSSSLVRLAVTNPLFLLNLRQQDGTTNVLANPRIRVKNKEKAKVHIGDRVPVITTTAAAVGGFISESVNYLDVGLKLEVEPLIHIGDEVSIRVGLEVSNIVREIVSGNSNTRTYQLGTRNASTVLRLRDGETQILAGLINDEDRRSANRVPGLGSLPVVGRLFSDTHETRGRTEIVLLITPRLLRTLDRPDNRVIEFAAGTEASTGGLPGGSSFPVAPPFTPPLPSSPGATIMQPGASSPTQAGQPAPPASLRDTPPSAPPMLPFGGLQRSPGL